MLNSADLLQLIKQGESPTLELKVNTPEPENLARLISSLANTLGGTIVVGVREPAQIIGTNIVRFENQVQAAKARCDGPLNMVHYSVNVNGINVGVIEIKRASIPISTSAGYFQRVGDSTKALEGRDLVQRMIAAPDHDNVIKSLVYELEKSRDAFEKANSIKTKFIWVMLGAVATGIVKTAFASFGFA